MTRIAVAGGTGVVGRLVVDRLVAGDHEAVALARSRGAEVVSGDGLDAALAGVAAVIDVTHRRLDAHPRCRREGHGNRRTAASLGRAARPPILRRMAAGD